MSCQLLSTGSCHDVTHSGSALMFFLNQDEMKSQHKHFKCVIGNYTFVWNVQGFLRDTVHLSTETLWCYMTLPRLITQDFPGLCLLQSRSRPAPITWTGVATFVKTQSQICKTHNEIWINQVLDYFGFVCQSRCLRNSAGRSLKNCQDLADVSNFRYDRNLKNLSNWP